MSHDPADYRPPEHVKFKGNVTRLGNKSDNCLVLGDLFEVSVRGWTPKQAVHVNACLECKLAFGHYMKMRRAIARDKLKLSMNGVPLPDMDRLK